MISQAFLPEVKAQPSLEDYRENVALQGCPFPPEAIPAHWLADSNGGYIRDIADSASTQAILGAPDVQLQYSAIQMPVLALYPIWRSSFDLPWSSTIGDTLRIRADNAVFLWEALRRRARLYFASQVPQAIFQGIPAAGHCMFMTHPREVAASIDAFLQQAPQ